MKAPLTLKKLCWSSHLTFVLYPDAITTTDNFFRSSLSCPAPIICTAVILPPVTFTSLSSSPQLVYRFYCLRVVPFLLRVCLSVLHFASRSLSTSFSSVCFSFSLYTVFIVFQWFCFCFVYACLPLIFLPAAYPPLFLVCLSSTCTLLHYIPHYLPFFFLFPASSSLPYRSRSVSSHYVEKTFKTCSKFYMASRGLSTGWHSYGQGR